MRIIAGTYGGRTIKAVPGSVTRPTASRIREAWASSVASLLPGGFEGTTVLDAFAGSGALGIEALSRGATDAVFVETSPRAVSVLKQNLSILDTNRHAATLLALDVFTSNAIRVLNKTGPYDLVILDPPYDSSVNRLCRWLQRLIENRLLKAGSLVSYEQQSKGGLPLTDSLLLSSGSLGGLMMVSCKTYGTTRLEYFSYQEGHSTEEH